MKTPLSVVIITFNEENNIERCLKSVEALADEIVVVDSYSTDKTKEICQNYSVRFIENEFLGHIEQKNFAKDQAKHDYVLSLDADEALSAESIDYIQNLKSFNFDGYVFNRLNNYCGKWIRHSGWYPDRKLRLWKKSKGKWAGQNPHDQFVLDSESKIETTGTDILHYTIPNAEAHLKQIDYFTTIAAKALFDKRKKGGWYKRFLSPIVKFQKDYFWQRGFLDGKEGFMIAKNSAYAKYLKYSKLEALYKEYESQST